MPELLPEQKSRRQSGRGTFPVEACMVHGRQRLMMIMEEEGMHALYLYSRQSHPTVKEV